MSPVGRVETQVNSTQIRARQRTDNLEESDLARLGDNNNTGHIHVHSASSDSSSSSSDSIPANISNSQQNQVNQDQKPKSNKLKTFGKILLVFGGIVSVFAGMSAIGGRKLVREAESVLKNNGNTLGEKFKAEEVNERFKQQVKSSEEWIESDDFKQTVEEGRKQLSEGFSKLTPEEKKKNEADYGFEFTEENITKYIQDILIKERIIPTIAIYEEFLEQISRPDSSTLFSIADFGETEGGKIPLIHVDITRGQNTRASTHLLADAGFVHEAGTGEIVVWHMKDNKLDSKSCTSPTAKQKAREAHMSPVFEISNNQVKLSRHTGFWAKVSAFFS